MPNPAAGGRLGAIVSADVSRGGIPAEFPGLIEPDKTNFGPRFGFAYSINDRTVVRGGYGIYYAPVIYNDFGNAGYLGYNPGQNPINGGLDAGITLENFPLLPLPNPADQAVGQLDRNDIDYFNKNYKAGRTAQWSLDIQRELPWNFAIPVGYIGSRGTRLKSNFNPINKLPLEALKLGFPLLTKRLVDVSGRRARFRGEPGLQPADGPERHLPGIQQRGWQPERDRRPGTEALPAVRDHQQPHGERGAEPLPRAQGRLAAPLLAGHPVRALLHEGEADGDAAEDVFGDSPLNGVVQNPYDREALDTISPSSLPHSLVFHYIIELPFGKGKRFLNQGGIVDRLAGGWQVTGIHRYRSGPALVPFISGGQRDFLTVAGFGGNLRPNFTGEPFYTTNPATGTQYQYLNPAAFSRPPDYRAVPLVDDPTNPDPTVLIPAPIGSAEYRAFYADPLRFFGNAPPSTNELRGQPFFSEDISIMKKTRVTETTYLEIRAEIFNVFNRGRFGLPVVDLNAGDFSLSFRNGDIFQPRRIQVGARFVF